MKTVVRNEMHYYFLAKVVFHLLLFCKTKVVFQSGPARLQMGLAAR